MINLAVIAAQLGLQSISAQNVLGFSIDTRTLKLGSVYVALKGPRFDGHAFIQEAAAKGAVAVICEKSSPDVSIPQLIVPSTQDALYQIARMHRQTITCPVIALTGSNGKTTVKEMIAGILPVPSHATPGNFNNHIGVPLALLGLCKAHRYAVFELGANHPGDIAQTVTIVKPHVALVNNIAPAHIEGFGSIDGVASTKGEIYAGLDPTGIAIINEDDDYAHFWDHLLINHQVLRFSQHQPADIYAQHIVLNQNGHPSFELILPDARARVHLNLPGLHQVSNALAAAACCHAAGIDINTIVQGLTQFHGVRGRMCLLPGIHDACVIDDTYNANLRSALTAIEVLARRPGQRIMVLGDMGELGIHTRAHHETIGLEAKAQGIDIVMTCGLQSLYTSQAFGTPQHHYATHDLLVEQLLPKLDATTTVLVKGSRSAAMEKVVRQIVEMPMFSGEH